MPCPVLDGVLRQKKDIRRKKYGNRNKLWTWVNNHVPVLVHKLYQMYHAIVKVLVSGNGEWVSDSYACVNGNSTLSSHFSGKSKTILKINPLGPPQWPSGWGSAHRCRGHGFNLPVVQEDPTGHGAAKPMRHNQREAPTPCIWRKPAHSKKNPAHSKIKKY